MSEMERKHDEMLARCLEQPPRVSVPTDFAARVRAALPPVRPARPRVSFGTSFSLVALGVSAAVTFALAPHATPSFSSFQFDLELLMLAQMAAIGWWMAARRRT